MTRQSKSAGVRLTAAERKQKALELRKAGCSYQVIGDELGVSRQQAHRYVTAALESIRKETAEEADNLRTIELERIDALFLECYAAAKKGNFPAVDRCVKLSERRCKILGLDAATRQEISACLVSSGEWQELRARILKTLEKYPDARAALLQELSNDED